jgi:hypothetical protein
MVASFESLLKFIVYIKVNIIQKWDVGDLWRCMDCMESLGIIMKLFVQTIKICICIARGINNRKTFGLDF